MAWLIWAALGVGGLTLVLEGVRKLTGRPRSPPTRFSDDLHRMGYPELSKFARKNDMKYPNEE
jgi:hypothetical protein